MDTWTYMEDMHYPVAPGSYRFGKGFAVKASPKNDPKFNLVCIRSGVKAPLLSDLSHRAKIRYGLDVVMQRPDPPTREYMHHEEYVPPPTAEPTSPTRGHKSLAKNPLEKARFLNLKKLQSYTWIPSVNKNKSVPRAPDLLYRNTFGENSQAHSNLLSPRPEVRGFGESARSPSPGRTPRRGTALQPSSARIGPPSRLGSPQRPVTRPVSEPIGSGPPTRQPRTLSGRRLLTSLSDMGELQPNIKPLSANSKQDQRDGLNGSSGCLFSQVQQSIKFVKKIEKGEPIDVPRLARPLHSENGRYRPHSRTKIATPRVQSPIHYGKGDQKSAEAYLKIIMPQVPNEAAKRKHSYTSMGSPAMTDIINQYMTSHERYNTPTSALQHVSDVNRPVSRTSTRQSVRFENIPAWARAETAQSMDNESELDQASRVQSRAEKIPAVHISYAEKGETQDSNAEQGEAQDTNAEQGDFEENKQENENVEQNTET